MNLSLLTARLAKARLRTYMIISEFFLKTRDYGIKYGWHSSLYWIGWYSPLKSLQWVGYRGKTKYLNEYIEKNFSSIISKYSQLEESATLCNEYNIFIFWWQGYDSMPDLVKACIKQAYKAEGTNIRLITRKNLKEYIDFPDYIYEKLNNGKITFTHFSDILRVSLLAKYGGMWVDATCWIPNEIPQAVKELALISPNTKGLDEIPLWSNSKWCSWNLGTNLSGSLLFSFVRDIFFEYHKGNQTMIDYLLIDYLLYYSYNKFSIVKEEIDNMPEYSTGRNALWTKMNNAFDHGEYNQLCKDNGIFKLSYKSRLTRETSGRETFYGHILNML